MKYDIGLITKYVLEYDAGIPKSVVLGISIITCGAVLLLSMLKPDHLALVRRVSWWMFLTYLLMVLCFTIIFREEKNVAQISMKPIWEYDSLNYNQIAEAILNVLLFMPLGLLAGAAIRRKRFLKTVGLCCGISVTIEILQLVLKKGVCNLGDLINNLAGCIVGCGLFLIIKQCGYYRIR
jgi:glycopeptide antibiotics resistance protein